MYLQSVLNYKWLHLFEIFVASGEKGRNLTQSYDKSPYT